jgi:hypothetical protein
MVQKKANNFLAKVNKHPPMHQHGWMLHWWVYLFLPPCPWVNQGGQFKLAFFFSFLQPRLVFFWEFFFPHPPCLPVSHLPTYLHLDYLPMHPPSPTYLPTHPPICLLSHQPTYPCIYALNLHQGNEGVAIYQVGCFVLLFTYLLTRSYNFVIVENKVAMTQSNVLQLNYISFGSPIQLNN